MDLSYTSVQEKNPECSLNPSTIVHSTHPLYTLRALYKHALMSNVD